MKVLVLGSGVIGVTSAYHLALAGHEVTVVDRQPAAALETSYGNAGEVSPGYSAPWAGPGVPVKAVKWLLMHHRPLVIRPEIDLHMIRWCLSMLRNCTAARYEVNKGRMVRLAEYSRDCMKELRAQTGIRYDERMQGTLQLFRTRKQLDGTGADIEVLKRYGVAWELLDRDGCIRHESALAHVREKFVGGLGCPATRPATASSSRRTSPRWPRSAGWRSATARASTR
jgi:D-amino-acid dehydrogenase